jgi:hypothetical protein
MACLGRMISSRKTHDAGANDRYTSHAILPLEE